LNVFIFTERQKDIAGTDGMVTFQEVFSQKANLAVTLLRERWGTTPFTRVEMEAIKARCFNGEWESCFWIGMDEAPPPRWLPPHFIRLNLKDFGIDQAVGAIKARALELGSKLQRASPAYLAKRSQQRAEFAERRRQLLHTDEGVRLAGAEAGRLITLISGKFKEIQQAGVAGEIEYGAAEHRAVLRIKGAALAVSYINYISNVLDEARLDIEESSGALMPGGAERFLQEPRSYGVSKYKPDLSQDLGWCWRASDDTLHTTESLADAAVDRFFALRDRHSAGKLPRPNR
jgi:hypothetical protein